MVLIFVIKREIYEKASDVKRWRIGSWNDLDMFLYCIIIDVFDIRRLLSRPSLDRGLVCKYVHYPPLSC